MMVDVSATKLKRIFVKRMGKSQFPQDFPDGTFYAKSDVKENLPMTKNIDLALNAIAQILIKHIRENVIHRASNCYFAPTSSTLY